MPSFGDDKRFSMRTVPFYSLTKLNGVYDHYPAVVQSKRLKIKHQVFPSGEKMQTEEPAAEVGPSSKPLIDQVQFSYDNESSMKGGSKSMLRGAEAAAAASYLGPNIMETSDSIYQKPYHQQAQESYNATSAQSSVPKEYIPLPLPGQAARTLTGIQKKRGGDRGAPQQNLLSHSINNAIQQVSEQNNADQQLLMQPLPPSFNAPPPSYPDDFQQARQYLQHHQQQHFNQYYDGNGNGNGQQQQWRR